MISGFNMSPPQYIILANLIMPQEDAACLSARLVRICCYYFDGLLKHLVQLCGRLKSSTQLDKSSALSDKVLVFLGLDICGFIIDIIHLWLCNYITLLFCTIF